jgi:hypothetical protein
MLRGAKYLGARVFHQLCMGQPGAGALGGEEPGYRSAKSWRQSGIRSRENSRIGASVSRFVERVGKTDRVIVVGTPLYRKKYDNQEPMRSFVVAAEGDLIGNRMIGTEAEKESVLPILLEGTSNTAFPHLLHGRVYADFRNSEDYFNTAFELLLSIYQIPLNHPVAVDLHESLIGRKER